MLDDSSMRLWCQNCREVQDHEIVGEPNFSQVKCKWCGLTRNRERIDVKGGYVIFSD